MLYPKDPSVTVKHQQGTLVIVYKWANGSGWAAIFLGALYAALPALILASAPHRKPQSVASVVGPLMFFELIGLAIAYYGAVHLMNRTTIVASPTSVDVTSGPLPASKSKHISGVGLKQFFVLPVNGKRGTIVFNRVYWVSPDDVVQPMLTNLNPFAAMQVRHELQDFYGLEDLEIYGVTTDPDHPGPRAK